jgi:hypothetical protein
MPAKRALSAALALLLAVSFAAPSGARALSADGFEYTLTGSDATVTGCTSTCPTTLVIPSTLGGYSVTTIGDSAFDGNSLTSVTIPNSVTSIGAYAFLSNALTTVTIGSSVTSIGTSAFEANALTTVTIGNSVTTIGTNAFWGNALTTVTIPNSVTTIGNYAFIYNALTSVTFMGDAPTAGTSVFYGNSGLTSVRKLLTANGWGSTWSGVAVVTVPVLSDNGFSYFQISGAATITGCDPTCPTILDIPVVLGGYFVTTIGSEAFSSQSLVALTIPSTVTSIGSSAFAANALTTVTIPDSVTSIAYNAFAENALTTVTIPSSVTSISIQAFAGNALTTVAIPNSVTTIGSYAFAYNALTTVTIPNSVTTIGSYAFYENNLTAVTIPNSVTSIGIQAFQDNALTTVTIPNSVTTIGSYAFYGNALTSVTFLGNAPIDGGNVFDSNSGLTSVTRSSTATGWGSTWGGKTVVIADARATATVKPTVTGTSTVGRTLTAAKGTWTGYPTPTFTYQWYACTTAVSAARTTVPSTCKKITGATRSTFKLTSAQRGKYVAVLVKGTSLRTTATTWLSKTTAKVR